MKKLSQLLESINEIDSLLELDFKDKKAFQKYQSIHKMKPTTKVNIAGKDTTVGDDFELIAFDFVSNPSTHGAFLYPMNESVDNTQTGRTCGEYCKAEDIINHIIRGE